MIDLKKPEDKQVNRMYINYDHEPEEGKIFEGGGVATFFEEIIKVMRRFGVTQFGCAHCDGNWNFGISYIIKKLWKKGRINND